MFRKEITLLTCAGCIYILRKCLEMGYLGGGLVCLFDGIDIAYDPYVTTWYWGFQRKW